MSPEDPKDRPQVERHSKAFEAELVHDPVEKAKLEARNGLHQFDIVIEIIDYYLQPDHPFKLRPSRILQLHRSALEGLTAFAGNYRPANIEIQGSQHTPVGAHLVPEKIEELCEYINDQWATKSPIHLAAYSLWRLNWIHPFTDGNGRTSRALSYVVLCLKLGYLLPGTHTIPDQIADNKNPYYEALEAADQAFAKGQIELTKLEGYLSGLLANQLLSIHKKATGK